MIRRVLLGLAAVPVVAALAWGAGALHFDGPRPAWLADVLAAAWAVAGIAALWRVRPFWRALAVVAVGFAVLLLWWTNIPASNDRDWLPDVAHIPRGEVEGDRLTLHDVRNFDYRSETDFTPRWEDRTYDLSRLRGLDLFMSYWAGPSIAHTIMSWDFDGGQHLAVSIETRKERGEEYSAVGGFFRQYELCYVAADERDLVRLRTNYRGEQVYLYRLRIAPDRARRALLEYVADMNELAAHPRFYNAATQNCTTTIRMLNQRLGAAPPWDWRLLVNGYGDEMLYERGTLDTSLPFAELKTRSLINPRAQAADQDASFSTRIRDGLSMPPPAAPPRP
jgi:hypothetical protein